MPERLRRLETTFARWPIYFVTACTAKRRKLLANDEIDDAFKCFAANGEERGAFVGAYILMPDHFHLFVVIDDTVTTLSAWMKSLKGQLSAVLRRRNETAPFWQIGFFDHVLRSGDSYSAKWEYVRENAVRTGLVSDWTEWSYLGEIVPLEFRNEGS